MFAFWIYSTAAKFNTKIIVWYTPPPHGILNSLCANATTKIMCTYQIKHNNINFVYTLD